MLKWTVVLLIGGAALVAPYPGYKNKIPNGDKVPNPCKPGEMWAGVGHNSAAGSDARNPFGLDMKANYLAWNATFCQKDSDGDGKRNGEELGDPNCLWVEGGTPSGAVQGHPGVCEPITDANCIQRNTFLPCNPSVSTTVATGKASPVLEGHFHWLLLIVFGISSIFFKVL